MVLLFEEIKIINFYVSGPNSECNRRARSMKGAHSMNSVYRKLHNDKNVHNDRHYLVSVTQQIKVRSSFLDRYQVC